MQHLQTHCAECSKGEVGNSSSKPRCCSHPPLWLPLTTTSSNPLPHPRLTVFTNPLPAGTGHQGVPCSGSGGVVGR